MADIVAWAALGISLALGIIKVVETIKYWKKPKVELELRILDSELKIKENKIFKLSLLVRVINAGNEDVFIEYLHLEHKGPKGERTLKPIKDKFNLPARSTSENFELDFGWLPYNPRRINGIDFERIKLRVGYGKRKELIKRLDFHISDKTKKISRYLDWDQKERKLSNKIIKIPH